MESWTVKRVVAWIQSDLARRGSSSPRLEADLLVCHGLGLSRIALYLDPDRPLLPGELTTIRSLVERRRRGEPMAYIRGQREFYGRAFHVSPAVLIPRPDTETLIDEALSLLRGELVEGDVLDLGTGSGAIALTLAAECPSRSYLATDVSEEALAVARDNAARLEVEDRVTFRAGNLFEALELSARFALIVSNPPYIGSDELATLEPDVRDFEPKLALDAGDDALSFYRQIAQRAPTVLIPGGVLLLEVGHTQAASVAALLADAGFCEVSRVPDLSGVERVVRARQPG